MPVTPPFSLNAKDSVMILSNLLTATFSVFAQLILQIAVSLSNGGACFIIKIWRKFFHAVNGPAMFQNLFKEFYFCTGTCRKIAPRPKIFEADHFVHVKTSSHFKNNYPSPEFKDDIGDCEALFAQEGMIII
jgi:hypothetical protein